MNRGLLQSVELSAFGSHVQTTIPFVEPVTLIVGGNGVGKSTVAEAILWGLTGRFARGLDGGGRGASVLVTEGSEKLRVALTLRDVGILKRIVGADGQMRLGLEGVSTGDAQAVLYDRIGTTPAFLQAVCTSDAFLNHDHTAGKAFLMDLLNVRVTINGEALTLAELQARHKEKYDERTALNRQIKEHRVAARPEGVAVAAAEVEALEAKLRELREQARTIGEQNAEARGRRTALEREHEALTRERATLEANVKNYGDSHTDLDALEAKLAALVDPALPIQGESPTSEIATVKASLVDARGRLRMLGDAKAAITGRDPQKGCVLDPAVPCLTPADKFTGRLSTLTKDLGKLDREIEKLTGRLILLEATLQTQGDEHAEYLRAVRVVQDERQRLDRDRRALQAKANHLQADTERFFAADVRLTTLAEELAALGPAGEDPPELVTLRTRITKGEATITEARREAERWSIYTAAAEQKATLNRQLATLETEVEQLGPKGAQLQAIEAALGGFLSRVNTPLGQFGYRLDVQLEPWKLLVNGRPAGRLSTSERLRVGLCLQLAIADLSDLQFVVIDNSEVFVDERIRHEFTDILFTWIEARDVRQAVVVKATEAEVMSMPGVAVCRLALEQGVSLVVGEAAA